MTLAVTQTDVVEVAASCCEAVTVGRTGRTSAFTGMICPRGGI